MDTVNDLNHIQIIYDLVVIRIYYVEKMFYICEVNHEAIIPKMFKKAFQVRDYLNTKLEKKINIDVRFFYNSVSTPSSKKIKVMDMNGYYSDCNLIYNLVLLLI